MAIAEHLSVQCSHPESVVGASQRKKKCANCEYPGDSELLPQHTKNAETRPELSCFISSFSVQYIQMIAVTIMTGGKMNAFTFATCPYSRASNFSRDR